MSKTLEEIITSPSLVRENWLPTELAVREVLAFERRFGLRHLKLACHAALPLILSPELVNLIHLNFLEGEGIPWVAEVDLLLSPLCRPVDEGLYEVEPAIREVLLVELENQFGWERPFTLAKFLEFYLARKSGLKLRPQIIQTQRWIAQAYLNPDLVVQEMTHLLESSLSEENHILGLSEQIQVTNTVELLAEPLERTNYHEEYQYLTDNSKVLSEIFYGDEQKLKEKIQQEQAEGEIREEELRQLAPSVLRQLGISRESREEKFKDLFSLELPAWLQECLSAYQSDSGQDKSEDNDLICRAFNFAYQLHRGQYCKSGKPYITHPIAVAGLLRDLGGSSTIIAAGFLHDVVEDTEVTPEEIEARFGFEVRNLVEAVTKLSKYNFFNFYSKTERQAENFRRMFLAMAKDIRVIVVKLAERLHNMQTLEYLNPQQQQRIALETREIFAPLANCLGIERFKWELEDLCFKYLEPYAYRTVQLLVSEKRIDREARIETVVNTLREKLQEIGIKVLDLQNKEQSFVQLKKAFDEYERAKLLREKIEAGIESLELKLEKEKSTQSKYFEQQTKIEENKKLEETLMKASARLSELTGEQSKLEREQGANTSNVETLRKRVEKNNDTILKIAQEFERERIYKIYLDVFGKNGISKLIMKTMMPLINSR